METGENNFRVIQSSKFHSNKTKEYHLSIQIGLKSLIFTLLNIKTLTYDYLHSFKFSSNNTRESEEKIRLIINENNLIKKSFSSISISYVNCPNTLIPNTLFKEEKANSVLNFNAKNHGHSLIDDIASQDAKIIYSFPKKIDKLLKTYFPFSKYTSQDKILLEYYTKIQKDKITIYAYFIEKKINITCFNKKNLVSHNHFEYKTKEDILYYVLFFYEQLNLSPKEIELVLHGEIQKEDYNFLILYDYIKNISFLKNTTEFKFCEKLKEIPIHKNIAIYNQILCV